MLRDLPDRAFDAILIGIKPQLLGEVAPGLARLVTGETVVLSILAGVELATLAKAFPAAGGIVRIMPNLAAAIGKSPVALVAAGLDPLRWRQVVGLMAAAGHGGSRWRAKRISMR